MLVRHCKPAFVFCFFLLLPCLVFFSELANGQEDSGRIVYGPAVSEASDAGTSPNAKNSKEKILNKILTDLSYRGKVADKMLESGIAGTLLNLSRYPTYSEAREAMIFWISKNPEKAADYAVMIQGSEKGNASPDSNLGIGSFGNDYSVDDHGNIVRTIYRFSLSDGFMSKIKALNNAAADRSLSLENLSEAGRKLFEGSSAYKGQLKSDFESAGGVYIGGGANGRRRGLSGDFRPAKYSGTYDNIKINRGAIDDESNRAGHLLALLRGNGGGPEGAEQYYSYAWKAYGNFAGYISPLKSRKVITEKEAVKLEQLRTDLRKALAGLSMQMMSLYAEEMSHSLNPSSAGYDSMLKSLRSLIESIEEKLVYAGNQKDLSEITKILSEAQAEFSALYMAYSVYSAAISIEKKAAETGFSCFTDWAIYKMLSYLSPQIPFVRARADIKNSSRDLSSSLEKAASGNLKDAIEDGRIDALSSAVSAVRAYSWQNKKHQYFFWGMLFRPFEIDISIVKDRAVFNPSFPWLIFKLEKMNNKIPAMQNDSMSGMAA